MKLLLLFLAGNVDNKSPRRPKIGFSSNETASENPNEATAAFDVQREER